MISQSSNACIRSIIIHSLPVKCLPRLLQALTDRSSALRTRAMDYVLLLLESLPVHAEGERCPLERHGGALAQTTRTALSDALSEVIPPCRWVPAASPSASLHFPPKPSP